MTAHAHTRQSYVAKNYIKVHLGGEDEVRPQG